MPLLLRTVRQSRWFKAPAAPFLAKGLIPADPLGDMATSGNRLSVWNVAPDRSNIERIVRAVALTKEKIADTGYVVFNSDLLVAAGVSTHEEKGATPDATANTWHRNLIDLSGEQLVALTKAILVAGDSGTVLKVRLRQLVEEGISAREIPEKLRAKLNQ